MENDKKESKIQCTKEPKDIPTIEPPEFRMRNHCSIIYEIYYMPISLPEFDELCVSIVDALLGSIWPSKAHNVFKEKRLLDLASLSASASLDKKIIPTRYKYTVCLYFFYLCCLLCRQKNTPKQILR